jgi:uncharacterized protein
MPMGISRGMVDANLSRIKNHCKIAIVLYHQKNSISTYLQKRSFASMERSRDTASADVHACFSEKSGSMVKKNGGKAAATSNVFAPRTAIGYGLRGKPGRLALAGVFCFLVLLGDFALVIWNRSPETIEGRAALALVALAAGIWLVDGDLSSIGFRLAPVQGWRYWAGATALLGLAVAVCLLMGWGICALTGYEPPIYTTAPREIGVGFLEKCIYYPVLEEVIYRLALCVPLVILIGPWRTIAVSGLVFAGLHFAYGCPSPENLIGGFLLAWAYLKSESILIPLLLHSTGNFCALAFQVGGWYYLQG